MAKSLVAAKLCEKVEVQIAYAIGKPEPLSVYVDSFGTGRVSNNELEKIVLRNFDLRPGMIIKELKLRQPLYRQVAAYGHFGRPELNLPWEKIRKIK